MRSFSEKKIIKGEKNAECQKNRNFETKILYKKKSHSSVKMRSLSISKLKLETDLEKKKKK